MERGNRALKERIDFHSLIKGCAEDPELVASFNRAYDAHLVVPITALLNDRWPHDVSPEEEILIGHFILFIHEHIWRPLQRAQHESAQKLVKVESVSPRYSSRGA